MNLDPYYEFREAMAQALVADLIGPQSEDELLHEAPLTRYGAGILYPRNAGTLDAEEDKDVSDEEGEGVQADPPVALANVKYPSSMGCSFAVDTSASPRVLISVKAARYVSVEPPVKEQAAAPEEGETASEDETPSGPRRAAKEEFWQRQPLIIAPVELDVTKPFSDYHPDFDALGLRLFCRVRAADEQGRVAVTAALLNRQIAAKDYARDAESVYQSEITIEGIGCAQGAFVERPERRGGGDDDDLRAYRLLYRHAREFAAGHGCSVTWETSEIDTSRACCIQTTWAPRYEVLSADSNPDIVSPALAMKYLAQGERESVTKDLEAFCVGYQSWIEARRGDIASLPANVQDTARDHLNDCETALARIRGGIKVLSSNDTAWRAFQFANAAMLQQRARVVWLGKGKPEGGPIEDDTALWRPFQLAFILLCLRGIAEPKSEERAVADLLWFPTGGGKTEAYLGLIAFTVFLRRMTKGKNGGGVTSLMRYTLRLLTIQQFERATLLICCCEAIRQAQPTMLGTEEISIGLYLGKGATPNSLGEARDALNQLKKKGEDSVTESNPVQVRSCPWCGHRLDWRNYWIAEAPKRCTVSCRQEGCDFKARLPVYVVDEDVYNFRPTLLIATVDKFAGLPWREDAAALFNLKHGANAEAPPPELIIQDELHLISGPLGTLTGLYETAVDELCTRDGVRPKVIASTATIRRSKQQGRGLFNREMHQFPPPGLDARDSYFAVQAAKGDKASRLYVGLMAPGLSHTTLLVRTYAALLQCAQETDAPAEVKDPYWTLVGYFNSLRVLGGARMQVQDAVQDHIQVLATQHTAKPRQWEDESVIEMTSRVSGSDIPKYLKQMALAYPKKDAVSVLLATNMISVGVDIDRLGLMAVMGQPQSTSEYIQSTSRVGRKFPGLVVDMLNSARSRDRSHYEHFVAYHSALYRQVEATSVTPFSARARDRGLHAVFVALARLRINALRKNATAADVETYEAELEQVKDIIIERVKAIDLALDRDEADHTAKQIDDIMGEWRKRADRGTLHYRDNDPAKALLRDAAEQGPNRDDGLPTLWSLRDVDQESNLYLTVLWDKEAAAAKTTAAAASTADESEATA